MDASRATQRSLQYAALGERLNHGIGLQSHSFANRAGTKRVPTRRARGQLPFLT